MRAICLGLARRLGSGECTLARPIALGHSRTHSSTFSNIFTKNPLNVLVRSTGPFDFSTGRRMRSSKEHVNIKELDSMPPEWGDLLLGRVADSNVKITAIDPDASEEWPTDSKIVRVTVSHQNLDEYVLKHYNDKYQFYCEDKMKECKIGDVVLIKRHLPGNETYVDHYVTETVFRVGRVVDPLTGMRVTSNKFIEYEKTIQDTVKSMMEDEQAV